MTVRVSFLGLPLDALTMLETVTNCDLLIQGGGCHQHVVLNAAKVVAAQADPRLADVIRGCSIVNADGQSIVWASRFLGCRVPERVAGIDLMERLWSLAAANSYSVFFLGAAPDVVSAVGDIARARGINVVGCRDGYWSDANEVVAEVAASQAQLLFLAIPSPEKEYFLASNLERLNVNLAIGVGGAFDVVAGSTLRAPRWMQRSGLEWAFRLIQEPRRMFKRYLVGNTRFVILVIHSRFCRGGS